MIDAVTLPEFDPADYLRTEEDIAAFLADLLADNNEALTKVALATACRAHIRLGLPIDDEEGNV